MDGLSLLLTSAPTWDEFVAEDIADRKQLEALAAARITPPTRVPATGEDMTDDPEGDPTP